MIPWRSRLRAQITLVAPDGTQFTASWAGNDIEAGKLVGQFNMPLGDGTITQDLGSKGLAFPLSLSFEGDTHDTDAFNFLRAMAQRGPWAVIHPVYGQFLLQPITATLSADPTSSGNISKVETSWVETPATDSTVSVAELGAQVSAQEDIANASAAAQFADACDLSEAETEAAAASAGTGALSFFTGSGLYTFIKGATDLQAAFATAYADVQAALASPMDVIAAAGQIQAIMQLPALVAGDLGAKISGYAAMAASLMGTIVPGSDSDSRNAAVMSELWLGATVAGAALSIVNTSPATRDQAVQIINDFTALFSDITEALDAVQDASAGNQANQQYFSNGLSFTDLSRLVGLTVAYLLRAIFDLKIAKRFTLDRPRHPGEIVIAEYAPADSSTYDSLYDLFIAANRLIGDDIILLPAGREVVVYT